jgi:hypothetical protein
LEKFLIWDLMSLSEAKAWLTMAGQAKVRLWHVGLRGKVHEFLVCHGSLDTGLPKSNGLKSDSSLSRCLDWVYSYRRF